MYREITKEEYKELFIKNDLVIFSSYTDMSGYEFSWSDGTPNWMTEYGKSNLINPLCKAESKVIDGEVVTKYFIYSIIK